MSTQRVVPNSFIVGAPKCGTTSLAHFLRQHPQVFFPVFKEPHYFTSDDMPDFSPGMSFEAYMTLFAEAESTHKVVAEGSVWYLRSKTAIDRIYKYNSESKIIVMLRRPDEMLYSMHNTNVRVYAESIPDFSDAWRASLEGQRRDYNEKYCRDPSILDYANIARFGSQVEWLLSVFPRNQVMIIFFEDFKKDTIGVFKQVERHLGLNHSDKICFKPLNQSARNRFHSIGRFVNKPPVKLVSVVVKARNVLGVGKLGFVDWLRMKNSIVEDRPPLSPVLSKSIISHYKSEIIKLSEITDKDLSDWLVVKPH
jgi:hypothetical protein